MTCRGWKEAHGLGISVKCVYGDSNGGRAQSFVLVILVSAAVGMISGVGEADAETE